jgi:hypothetical protein
MKIKLLAFSCALVVVACGGAREAAPEPAFQKQTFNALEACRTTTLSRYARGAECPGARVLFVSRQPVPEEVLRGTQAALAAYQYTATERVLSVNNRDQPTLEYLMGREDAPVLHVLFTAFGLPSGESIEAQCYDYGTMVEPKRCAALLDGFVAQGLLRGEWPKGLGDSQPQRLPSSCYTLGPLDIECKDGHVRLYVSDAPDKLARMQQVDLEATGDPSLIAERPVPCTLEGVTSTCFMRRFRLPYGDELLSFHGHGLVRGTPLLLSCEVKKSLARPVPGPICGQFFTFEPDVLEEPQSLTREE